MILTVVLELLLDVPEVLEVLEVLEVVLGGHVLKPNIIKNPMH